MPQQGKPLDIQGASQMLNNLKRQMSQIAGEASQQQSDGLSSLFNNFGQLLTQIFRQLEESDSKLKSNSEILEKIYHGHPDIQIQMQKDAKEKAQADSKKAPAKVVKGK